MPHPRPMHRNDLAAVGRIFARAFMDDPFYVVLFPDPAVRERILPTYFERSASDAIELETAWVAETPDHQVAGAALWAPPTSAGSRDARAPHGEHTDLFGADAFGTYATVMDHLRTHRTASIGSPHWYLNLVGVHPTARGLGLGRALLQPTLDRADREGRATALETFAKANLPLYAHFGFGVAHAGCEPRTGLPWWLLTRRATVHGSGSSVAQDEPSRASNAAANTRASDSE